MIRPVSISAIAPASAQSLLGPAYNRRPTADLDLPMALVVFRSKAAGEIFMFAETARRIFDILGRPDAPRGVITAEQVPDALERLTAAVEEEKAQLKAAEAEADLRDKEGANGVSARAITLAQRAFPLLEMLRAARKSNVDVTWGI
jgi:hypothetical protein